MRVHKFSQNLTRMPIRIVMIRMLHCFSFASLFATMTSVNMLVVVVVEVLVLVEMGFRHDKKSNFAFFLSRKASFLELNSFCDLLSWVITFLTLSCFCFLEQKTIKLNLENWRYFGKRTSDTVSTQLGSRSNTHCAPVWARAIYNQGSLTHAQRSLAL